MVASAIGRPYMGYTRTIAEKAAVLAESMATNHGFADGNKRTTVILIHLLLTKSGYELAPVTGDADIGAALEELVLSIVEHRRKLPDVVDWFKARIRKRKLPVPTASR
jgi:death on curing protein